MGARLVGDGHRVPEWHHYCRYSVVKDGKVMERGHTSCIHVAKDLALRNKAQLWRNYVGYSTLVIDYAKDSL